MSGVHFYRADCGNQFFLHRERHLTASHFLLLKKKKKEVRTDAPTRRAREKAEAAPVGAAVGTGVGAEDEDFGVLGLLLLPW